MPGCSLVTGRIHFFEVSEQAEQRWPMEWVLIKLEDSKIPLYPPLDKSGHIFARSWLQTARAELSSGEWLTGRHCHGQAKSLTIVIL